MKEQVNRTIKINAGIACLDRTNEVEPRPNEGYPYRHCEERSDVAIPNNQCVFGQGINAGIACSDRTNEVEPRPNEDRARAESPKSIAQGNALCNELHPSPSSPERAKSFVNNRLRSEQGKGANFQFLILTCHPYGVPFTVIAKEARLKQPSLRARRSQSLTINAFLVRDCFAALAMTVGGCFAEPVPNKVWGLAMTALFGRFCVFSHSLFRALAHFQFSIFNFQLD